MPTSVTLPTSRGTGPDPRSRGPSLRALAVLVIAGLALIATSPAIPSIDGQINGEVVLGGGESAERELRIHVDPGGGGATRGSIFLTFRAGSGLQTGYTADAALAFLAASDAGGSFLPDNDFPVERCVAGCDLVYRIRIRTLPNVVAGSVIRYEAGVRLEYSGFGNRDPSLLRLDLEGQASRPVAPFWGILAGLLALVGGIAAGPAVDRALAPRRRLPALGLIAMAVGTIGWIVIDRVTYLASVDAFARIGLSPRLLLAFVDPWSAALIGILVWGLWRGLRRWPEDGGWVLGLASVATVGLGGLWLGYWSTLDPVVQPILFAIPFVLLGGVGGIVIGQAWRTDERAKTDRWWGALAVLSHGIIIAGFGWVAQESLFDPFATAPTSFLALIPAVLVTMAFRRWLGGRQTWLVLFDLIVAAVGLLGLWLWSGAFVGFTTDPGRLETDDVGVLLAVGASLVALGTSMHVIRRIPGADPVEARAIDQAHPVVPVRQPIVDDPPTT